MMNTHTYKTSENKNQAAANSLPVQQKKNESVFQLIDNRPESIAKRKMQNAINNAPRVQESGTHLEMPNNNQEVKQLKGYYVMTDNRTQLKVKNRFPEIKVAQLTKEDRRRRGSEKVTKKFENLDQEAKDAAKVKIDAAKALRRTRNKGIRERYKVTRDTKEEQTDTYLKSGAGSSFSIFKESALIKFNRLIMQVNVFEKVAKGAKFANEEEAFKTFLTWVESLESMKNNVINEGGNKKFSYGSPDLKHRIQGILSSSGVLKFSVLSKELSQEEATRIKRVNKGEALPDGTYKESDTKGKYDRKRSGLRLGIANESGIGLFARMMAAFGDEVKSIRTEWGLLLGDNYASYQSALGENGGDKLGAAKKTWTHNVASMYGLSHVKPAENIDGNVSFSFEKEPAPVAPVLPVAPIAE